MAEVVDKDRGWASIMAAGMAAELEVTAGVPADAPKYESGASPATVGLIYEYGIGVDARPWLAPSIDAISDELVAITEREFITPLLQGRPNVKHAGEVLGEAMVEAARRGIVGQGLVDTGRLYESVDYKIVKAKP